MEIENNMNTTHANNGISQSDQTTSGNFEITLSVSPKKIEKKLDGNKITNFITRTYDSTDETALKKVFTENVYSPNVWNGACSNANYVGMSAIALDIDDNMTLQQAKELFAPFNYIIHTSSSHQVLKNGVAADRFRVLLPLSGTDIKTLTAEEHQAIYANILEKYPAADRACKDPARKYFPWTPENEAPFDLCINTTGAYFDIDEFRKPRVQHDQDGLHDSAFEFSDDLVLNSAEDLKRVLKFDRFIPWCNAQAKSGLSEPLWYALISNLSRFEGGRELIHEISALDPVPGRYCEAETDAKIEQSLKTSGPIGYRKIKEYGWPGNVPDLPIAPAGWAHLGRICHREPIGKDKHKYIHFNDTLIIGSKTGWEAVTLEDTKKYFTNDRRQLVCVCPQCDNDCAILSRDDYGFRQINCSECGSAFQESGLSDNIFMYKSEILRIEQRFDEFSSIEVMKPENFKSNEDYWYVKKALANSDSRRFLSDNFQIRRIGDASLETLSYEYAVQQNAVLFKYPALPGDVDDNSYINNFLDNMFGMYAEFIRDWLAMYAYTNYVSLPVIVLAGPRGTGKGTFANLVWNIFPTLSKTWTGDKSQFNENYKGKLLFVDENANSSKASQYAEIKMITGNAVVRINEKFTPEYYIPNNVKIIMATNDPRPIFLKADEVPQSESNNNFFIYSCPQIAGSIDEQLGAELKRRLGHYVRTELKSRFEVLQRTRGTNNRYGIKCPITDFAKGLFASSKSSVELEAEELAEQLQLSISGKRNIFSGLPHWDVRLANDGYCYIQQRSIREMAKSLGFRHDPKELIQCLQNNHILSYDSDYRQNSLRLGYRILVKPECRVESVTDCDSEKESDKSDNSDFSGEAECHAKAA